MKEEIKIVECDTVGAAELEYFKLREEGCWQVCEPLKIVWSWKKLKNVARFSVKKVEKRYDFGDYMESLNKAIQKSMEVLPTLAQAMAARNKRRVEQRISELLKNK